MDKEFFIQDEQTKALIFFYKGLRQNNLGMKTAIMKI